MADRCAKCGSDRVVPQARLFDQGYLEAAVDAKPDALVFKGTESAKLYARLCAECGHAELFAKPQEVARLYEVYCQRAGEDRSER
jgi:hypothetical protein